MTNDDLTPDVRDQELPDGSLPDSTLPDSGLQWQPPTSADLPERLRVHTLARVLGTTSRRVLDALNELDGRSRSAQSSVDQADAIRVREVLAAAENAIANGTAITAANPAMEAESETEPESRLILETHETAPHETAPATEIPAYMPLFVAPQPVERSPVDLEAVSEGDDEGSDEDGEDGDSDDRPANRRRRRGRRGRGRGRGEQGGPDDEADAAKDTEDAEDAEGNEDAEDGEESEAGDDESATGEGGTRRRRPAAEL